jgi:hypothetical protein
MNWEDDFNAEFKKAADVKSGSQRAGDCEEDGCKQRGVWTVEAASDGKRLCQFCLNRRRLR